MTGSAQQTSRRHHTVPRFYLRGFAAGETLLTVQLPGDRRYRQSTGNASVETDFYALAGHSGGDDVLERALSDVESSAAKVIARIAAGTWPLAEEDRMALGFFIALQSTRTQSHRRTANSIAAQVARIKIGFGGRASFKEQLVELSDDVTDEVVDRMWAEAVRPEGPPITVSSGDFAQQMLETATELLPAIVGRPWTLVRFNRRSLVTSDHPVSLVPQPDSGPHDGVGYLTAWGIAMPLTRKLGLIMSDPMPFADHFAVERVRAGELDFLKAPDTQMERFLNDQTVRYASQYLYLHPDDERFLPDVLPGPRPTSVEMSSTRIEFNGEP
ncbi:DUF4238 domain-containing protein [Clavibacter michiganensis subsp. phaseoli]|uniref:DUF4238 domain-containing protein n=1 Tax=Clavibacter phaseoli TaxID=1734031 RepID=A0A8I0SBU0_9MICO|nr:DUF4238 domain-containing protein [Clavibacter phaseoli]MBF4632738.1 DUF4238 domain-containing protein [Clavibacter phaseoli]